MSFKVSVFVGPRKVLFADAVSRKGLRECFDLMQQYSQVGFLASVEHQPDVVARDRVTFTPARVLYDKGDLVFRVRRVPEDEEDPDAG
jgi:hypothetical protein